MLQMAHAGGSPPHVLVRISTGTHRISSVKLQRLVDAGRINLNINAVSPDEGKTWMTAPAALVALGQKSSPHERQPPLSPGMGVNPTGSGGGVRQHLLPMLISGGAALLVCGFIAQQFYSDRQLKERLAVRAQAEAAQQEVDRRAAEDRILTQEVERKRRAEEVAEQEREKHAREVAEHAAAEQARREQEEAGRREARASQEIERQFDHRRQATVDGWQEYQAVKGSFVAWIMAWKATPKDMGAIKAASVAFATRARLKSIPADMDQSVAAAINTHIANMVLSTSSVTECWEKNESMENRQQSELGQTIVKAGETGNRDLALLVILSTLAQQGQDTKAKQQEIVAELEAIEDAMVKRLSGSADLLEAARKRAEETYHVELVDRAAVAK